MKKRLIDYHVISILLYGNKGWDNFQMKRKHGKDVVLNKGVENKSMMEYVINEEVLRKAETKNILNKKETVVISVVMCKESLENVTHTSVTESKRCRGKH